MSECIFCKIVEGRIPANKVYESEEVLVFLDIYPKTRGHCLVIPKNHAKTVWDLDDNSYQELMGSVKEVADRLNEVLSPRHIGLQVEGLDVNHAHVHVFGFNDSAEYRSTPDMSVEPDFEALAALAKKLAF